MRNTPKCSKQTHPKPRRLRVISTKQDHIPKQITTRMADTKQAHITERITDAVKDTETGTCVSGMADIEWKRITRTMNTK